MGTSLNVPVELTYFTEFKYYLESFCVTFQLTPDNFN